ncbi:MAG: outer membrane beta-barrel protein [Opitutales bacterium]
MKQSDILTLAFIAQTFFLPAVTQASAFISIGDGTEIYLNSTASVRSNSNVFRQASDEESDVVATVSPGFELNSGRGTDLNITVRTRYDIASYADLNELDNEAFHLNGLTSYATERLQLSADASFDEYNSTFLNNFEPVAVNDLIELEVVAASVLGEYKLTPKFSFSAGVNYKDTDFIGVADLLAADTELTAVPFNLYYELTPKLDLSLGYRYAETEYTERPFGLPSYENEQQFFSVGLRGDLRAKLKGTLKAGYRENENSVTNHKTATLGVDGDLTWSLTPKLTSQLALSRDFGAGGDGTTTQESSIAINNNYMINENWSARANLKYSNRDYVSDREDDTYLASLRLNYIMNVHWSFSGGYTYSENDSTRPADYTDHAFDLSVAVRY